MGLRENHGTSKEYNRYASGLSMSASRAPPVVYDHYRITILGSVPAQTASGTAKLEFRIRAEIDKAAVRRNAQRQIAATRLANRAASHVPIHAAVRATTSPLVTRGHQTTV
jgi:hypothetical protein